MITMKRFLLASLTAPLAIIPAYIAGGLLVEINQITTQAAFWNALHSLFLSSVVLLIVTYPATFILGGPTLAALTKYDQLSLLHLNIIGWLGASVVAFLFADWFTAFLVGCYLSSVISGTFWLMIRGSILSTNPVQP